VIHHLGVSGGKDSTALLLWAVHESGLPIESLNVTFADTGNESQITLDYVAMLSEKVHPITTLHPERDFYALAKHKHRFPSPRARFCTTELKMKPSRDHVWALRDSGQRVTMLSGVRAAEA
jgi:3'-phosphoadenosine 5'-phosphosulfate sulfotransferase (PAPS reductase)/FAD synthetase